MVKLLHRLCVLLPLLLIEIEIWPFKIEFWALFFRFLHLWFLQGLPLSALVVIGSLTFSDWCQRLPGWPGPQPSTLLWRERCLSKHEAFSSSNISTSFKIHCTFYWILHWSFGWALSFVWRAPKRKCCHARKHSTSNGLLVIIFCQLCQCSSDFLQVLAMFTSVTAKINWVVRSTLLVEIVQSHICKSKFRVILICRQVYTVKWKIFPKMVAP